MAWSKGGWRAREDKRSAAGVEAVDKGPSGFRCGLAKAAIIESRWERVAVLLPVVLGSWAGGRRGSAAVASRRDLSATANRQGGRQAATEEGATSTATPSGAARLRRWDWGGSGGREWVQDCERAQVRTEGGDGSETLECIQMSCQGQLVTCARPLLAEGRDEKPGGPASASAASEAVCSRERRPESPSSPQTGCAVKQGAVMAASRGCWRVRKHGD